MASNTPADAPAEATNDTPTEAKAEAAASPNGRVKVYDTNTKEKLPGTVPASWLDGRFPNLKLVPSTDTKAGK